MRRRFTRKARQVFGYLGANIRRARTAKGVTQEKLAELGNVDVRFVQLIEAGETNVGLAVLVDLADVLDVTVAALLRPSKLPERRVGRPTAVKP